jgi:hypothetical protein
VKTIENTGVSVGLHVFISKNILKKSQNVTICYKNQQSLVERITGPIRI